MCGIFTGTYTSIDFTFKHMFLLMFCPLICSIILPMNSTLVLFWMSFIFPCFWGYRNGSNGNLFHLAEMFQICVLLFLFHMCVYICVCMPSKALMESLKETRPLAISLWIIQKKQKQQQHLQQQQKKSLNKIILMNTIN